MSFASWLASWLPTAPIAAPAPSVSDQIDAVTWAQGISALSTLATSLSAASQSVPSGAIVIAEDIAAVVDPSLIPVIGGIKLILPLVEDALALVEAGVIVPGQPSGVDSAPHSAGR